MTGSVYQKTALPAKLDLTKYNTREQLKDTERTAKTVVSGAAADSRKDCDDVMRKDLREWLVRHDIHGPPPNAVAEQKAMWAWIRDFHAEYNEDWFSRNMPRLHEQFKPIFVQEMKAMKAAAKAAAPAPSADMLDFEVPAAATAASPAPASSSSGMDLLDISEPAPTPAAPAAAAPAAQPAASYAANLSSTLLDLDMGSNATGSASSAGYGNSQPATAPSVPAPLGSDLLLDPFTGIDSAKTPGSAQPAAASGLAGLDFMAATAPAPVAVPVAAPAAGGLVGLDFGAPGLAGAASAGPQASAAPLAGMDFGGLDLGGAGFAAPVVTPAPVQPSPSSNEPNLLDLL